jgi:hypothetical protein
LPFQAKFLVQFWCNYGAIRNKPGGFNRQNRQFGLSQNAIFVRILDTKHALDTINA